MEVSKSSSKGQENEVRELYQKVIDGWNKRSADAMAEPFAEDGELIGFDGSQVIGKKKSFHIFNRFLLITQLPHS